MRMQFFKLKKSFGNKPKYYTGSALKGYTITEKISNTGKIILSHSGLKGQSYNLTDYYISHQQLQDMLKMTTHYEVTFYTEEEWFLKQL
jgi:hypothetical protein